MLLANTLVSFLAFQNSKLSGEMGLLELFLVFVLFLKNSLREKQNCLDNNKQDPKPNKLPFLLSALRLLQIAMRPVCLTEQNGSRHCLRPVSNSLLTSTEASVFVFVLFFPPVALVDLGAGSHAQEHQLAEG